MVDFGYVTKLKSSTPSHVISIKMLFVACFIMIDAPKFKV